MMLRRLRKPMFCAVTALVLASCAGTATYKAAPRIAVANQAFALSPQQSIALPDGSQLRHERVANDSRCPAHVQCVWAGDAEVVFSWISAAGVTETFSLRTGTAPRDRKLGPYVLRLRALDRSTPPTPTLMLEPGLP